MTHPVADFVHTTAWPSLDPTTATVAGSAALPLLMPCASAQHAPVTVPRFSMAQVPPVFVQTTAHLCLNASSLLTSYLAVIVDIPCHTVASAQRAEVDHGPRRRPEESVEGAGSC